jgi:hypothetical protein
VYRDNGRRIQDTVSSENKPMMHVGTDMQWQIATKITDLEDVLPVRTCYRVHKRSAVGHGEPAVQQLVAR